MGGFSLKNWLMRPKEYYFVKSSLKLAVWKKFKCVDNQLQLKISIFSTHVWEEREVLLTWVECQHIWTSAKQTIDPNLFKHTR